MKALTRTVLSGARSHAVAYSGQPVSRKSSLFGFGRYWHPVQVSSTGTPLDCVYLLPRPKLTKMVAQKISPKSR